jgi:hypothetical protein
VKVVPRLVEHKAAPAAKAWRGVASKSLRREKDRAMGTAIPVMATADDSHRLALSDWNDVDRPPERGQRRGKEYIKGGGIKTLIDQ